MKQYLQPLGKYINFLLLAITLYFCVAVMFVNVTYIDKLNHTIDTMWHEIEQVKETNIKLYQFIEGDKNNGS
tara:strand:+ start:2109 stop:2324 length:216 start_codon:yes stop_codon:yes gene_type:complete